MDQDILQVKYELLKNAIRFGPSLTVWELWDLFITDVLEDLQVAGRR
jgi:hypothetical protein